MRSRQCQFPELQRLDAPRLYVNHVLRVLHHPFDGEERFFADEQAVSLEKLWRDNGV